MTRKKKKKGFLGLVIVLLVVLSLIASGVLLTLPKAEIQVSNLVIEPQEVLVGDPVVVSADIENKGRAAGDYQATLTVNGEVWETKNLNVPAGSVQSVSFTITPTSLGQYKIALGELTAYLSVKEGMLPPWYAGDLWTYKVKRGEEEFEVSYEVMGETTIESIVTYVVEFSETPPLNTYDKSTSFLNKGTLYPISEERSGTVDNITVSEKITIVNRQIQGSPWPLAVGGQWTVNWSENFTSKVGLVVTKGERQFSRTFNVEGKEEVTTAAGVFSCFKVVESDETGNVVGTAWYSDKTKREVKYELMIQGVPVIYELISYQVSTTPPETPPSPLEFPALTEYEEPTYGYILSYPEGWDLEPDEEQPGTMYVYTASGARGYRFAWVGIWPIANTDNLTLDEQYEKIMADFVEADPKFELVDSIKVEAELPWYEVEWSSWLGEDGVKLEGKIIIALKGEWLFMVKGWVQAASSEEYGSALEKVIDSFGVNPLAELPPPSMVPRPRIELGTP